MTCVIGGETVQQLGWGRNNLVQPWHSCAESHGVRRTALVFESRRALTICIGHNAWAERLMSRIPAVIVAGVHAAGDGKVDLGQESSRKHKEVVARG